MSWKLVGAATLALALGACGSNSEDRTTGGAAAGAATGAGIGAFGGPVGALAGAAIGGGAGAITGAATSPRDVNLGTPPWSNPETRVPGVQEGSSGRHRGGSASGTVRQAQEALNSRGFNAGTADGVWGPRTQEALTAFQQANNLEATGRLNAPTRQALNIGGGGEGRTAARAERDRAYMGGGMAAPAETGSPAAPAPATGGSPAPSYNPGQSPTTPTPGTGGTVAPGSSTPSAPR
ncbi:peptidoglycan-binding domain-containing protein [Siccirubricoccus phaeus]|uniref:peptidoglycan-binding domain-containing protein n=1 Tax=Siccirubricoccus phaeus TaxID=2595053 RepID=UPI001A9C8EE6|nr:peptidoglycan-binding domain-containing protein [Siccirubricoccus phaeus]